MLGDEGTRFMRWPSFPMLHVDLFDLATGVPRDEMKGFSPRNLKYMRAFAAAWPDEPFVQQLAAQIPWFHNCVLLDKLSDA